MSTAALDAASRKAIRLTGSQLLETARAKIARPLLQKGRVLKLSPKPLTA